MSQRGINREVMFTISRDISTSFVLQASEEGRFDSYGSEHASPRTHTVIDSFACVISITIQYTNVEFMLTSCITLQFLLYHAIY